MRFKPTVFGLVLAAWAAGCASSPAHRYYTLDMRPADNEGPLYNIEIHRLRPSEALARNDILIQKTPTEIEYYAADRWAASVGELVREKLAVEFGRRQEAPATVAVSGDILAFEQVDHQDGAQVRVKLDLAFWFENVSARDAPALKKTYECVRPAPAPTPAAVAEGLSRALERIAEEIAADVNALEPD